MNSTAVPDLDYSIGMAVCAVMAVVNVSRFKSRGPAAAAMASAFVTFGFTLWMAQSHVDQRLVIAGIVVSALLLGLDFGLRAARLPRRGIRK